MFPILLYGSDFAIQINQTIVHNQLGLLFTPIVILKINNK